MIRVGKQVGRKLIVIPYKAFFKVVNNMPKVNFSKVTFQYKPIKAMHKSVDSRCLNCR